MPLLTEAELGAFPETPVRDVVGAYVARYWDMMALANEGVCKVIGADALLKDRPGFEVDFINRHSLPDGPYSTDRHEVLMVMRGHWQLESDAGNPVLSPGDTCLLAPGLQRTLAPSMSGEASLFRVRNTDDPAGLTGV